MTSVSVVVGMKGVVAMNARDFAPALVHVPLTGGSKFGIPAALATGDDI